MDRPTPVEKNSTQALNARIPAATHRRLRVQARRHDTTIEHAVAVCCEIALSALERLTPEEFETYFGRLDLKGRYKRNPDTILKSRYMRHVRQMQLRGDLARAIGLGESDEGGGGDGA